jgi:hypothetical protein
MLSRVLKPFTYGSDGINAERLKVNDVRDVPESMVHGLTMAGYIEAVEPEGATDRDPRRVKPKGISAAPENKAIESAPSTKASASEGD